MTKKKDEPRLVLGTGAAGDPQDPAARAPRPAVAPVEPVAAPAPAPVAARAPERS